jgi:peptidoglycan hydrolase-like protein with peptidoglycan-binding domain
MTAKKAPATPKSASDEQVATLLGCPVKDLPAYVAAYQRAAMLPVTGEVDAKTWESMTR